MSGWKEKLRARLPAVILLVATLLFWGLYDRYEVLGDSLLDAPTLADARRVQGDCVERDGRFVLTVEEGGPVAKVNFQLPGALEHGQIRVRGRMRGERVLEGSRPWRCARIVLIQYDENDRWVPGHHSLSAESGTFGWKATESVFEVLPGAARADLVIQNLGRSGVVAFERLVAEPVRPRASFVWWRNVFAAAWTALAVVYFKRCRLDHRKLRILIVLNVTAILMGTLMPGSWISKPSENLKEWFSKRAVHSAPKVSAAPSEKDAAAQAAANQERIDSFNAVVGGAHKAGHFVLFAGLCFLVYCSAALEGQGPGHYFKVGGDLLLFAAVSESLQHLTLDRSPGFGDFMTDVYGMALAFVVFCLFRRRPAFRRLERGV